MQSKKISVNLWIMQKPKVKQFLTNDLIKSDIYKEYWKALKRLSKDDKFHNTKLSSTETQRKHSLHSSETLNKKTKRTKKKRTIIDYIERKEGAYKNNKIKSIFYFDEEQSNSVKSLAIEGHGYI